MMENGESRVASIFFAALEKELPEERAAYPDAACAGDEDLRGRVEKLLGAHPKLGGFLEGDAADLAATQHMPPIAERPLDLRKKTAGAQPEYDRQWQRDWKVPSE
jgi:hypothetical protein